MIVKIALLMTMMFTSPALAMTPAAANLTCGAGHIRLSIFTDHNGHTTIITGLLNEIHQSDGTWHHDTLDWDVGETSGNFHFAFDISTVQLVITPPPAFGDA